MKNWLTRLLTLAALVAAGIWAWHFFFPSPERVIRKQLNDLARAASIAPNEGSLAKQANVLRVSSFFSTDAQVTVNLPGLPGYAFNGRDELLQAAVAARNVLSALRVEFPDIAITLGPDKTTAVAFLTAQATVPGDKNFGPQELKASLQRIDGHWLVTSVETAKTLR